MKFFIYIDIDSINSLYRQLFEETPSIHDTITNSVSGTVSSGLGMNALLKAKIDSELNTNIEIKEENQKRDIAERYTEKILYRLTENKEVDTLFSVLENVFQNDRTAVGTTKLVVFKSIFRFLCAYDEEKEQFVYQSDIKKHPIKHHPFSFYFGSTPSLQFCSNDLNIIKKSLESGESYVELLFSSSNMVRNVRHLTNNIRYNSDFIMYILGEITLVKEKTFCVKPYAIWRMSDNNM